MKSWDEMEQRLHIGPPEPGSEREGEFEASVKAIRDIVLNVVQQRREGVTTRDIPFIDALLQAQFPEDQV